VNFSGDTVQYLTTVPEDLSPYSGIGNFCNDSTACNYNYCSTSAFNCSYTSNSELQLYAELFGSLSYGVGDTLLGNVGYVQVQETGQIFLPNEEGRIVISDLGPDSLYTLNFVNTNGQWQAEPITINYPQCQTQYFALTNINEQQQPGVTVISPIQWWNNTMHCVGGFYPSTYLYNTGATPISGTYTVTFNPELNIDNSYSAFNGNNITVETGSLTWDIATFNPDEQVYLPLHFFGPGSAFTGDTLAFTYTLVLRDDQDSIFYENTWNADVLVACSYDPNDKSAQPIGYTDQHYIAAGQELEYRIRF